MAIIMKLQKNGHQHTCTR